MIDLSFFNSSNSQYLEEMYEKYLQDPNSVDQSLQYFFCGFEARQTEIKVDVQTGVVRRGKMPSEFYQDFEYSSASMPGKNQMDRQERVFELISAYRKYGHLSAHINPLGQPVLSSFLNLSEHGLSESEIGRAHV